MNLSRFTLIYKLLFLYLVLFISAFTFIHTIGADHVKQKVIEDSLIILEESGKSILSHYNHGQPYSQKQHSVFQKELILSADAINCRVLVIDHSGTILVDTENKNLNESIYHYDTDFFQKGTITNLSVEELTAEPVLCLSFYTQSGGYLSLMQPMKPIETRADYYFYILNSLFYIIMSVLGIAFIIIYFANITPLRRLMKAAKSFSIRRSNPPIRMLINDEYRDLAETLNIIGE